MDIFPNKNNSNIQMDKKVEIPIPKPIKPNRIPFRGVDILKCDGTPLNAWKRSTEISIIITTAVTLDIILDDLMYGCFNSFKNQAIVQENKPIEKQNFIGLIHGLIPIIKRSSNSIGTSNKMPVMNIMNPTLYNKGSRPKSSAKALEIFMN